MEFLNTLFSEYAFLIDFLKTVLFLFVSVVLFIKTGNIKYIREVIKSMDYRLPNYQDGEPQKGQTFDRFAKVYRLNKSTNELELTDEVVDVQEQIDSCLEMCLDKALQRLMPAEQIDDKIVEYDALRDDLDDLQAISNLTEDYKEKLGLDPSLSFSQVFDILQKKSVDLKTEIEQEQKARANVEQLKNVISEDKSNEKETIEKSE